MILYYSKVEQRGTISTARPTFTRPRDTGVCENQLLRHEPFPCSTAAETPLQPLIVCFSSQFPQGYSSPEECFYSQTPDTCC